MRRNGRSVSTAAGAGVSAGASPNAGGALPKSPAVGAGAGVATACGATGCGTSGEGLNHCACCGTLTSGAVPTPTVFPLRSPRSFLYHV